MKRKVYQLVVCDLEGLKCHYLSVYDTEETANEICEEMNHDFTLARISRIARVEIKDFYEMQH